MKHYSIMFATLIIFSALPAFADSDKIYVETDKVEYYSGDELILSGFVEEKKMPVIAMRVYDPNGSILSANSLELDEDGSFYKTIFLNSPFYDEVGEYKITLDYTKYSTEIFFEIISDTLKEIFEEEKIIPEIIDMNSSQKTYYDDEFIIIEGTVSTNDSSSVLIGIMDPFGTPTGFYFGDIDTNNNFKISFLAKSGVNFKIDGIYSVVAHYADSEYVIEFEFKSEYELVDDEIETEYKLIQVDLEISSIIEDEEEIIETIKEPVIEIEEKVNDQQIILTEISVEQKPMTKQIIPEKTLKKKFQPEPIEYDNLSVEDVELGILLNQITLNCDQSEYSYSILYYDGLGPSLMRLCNYEQAIEYFDESIKDNPNNAEALTNKGSALSKLGFFEEGLLYYDSALEIEPDFYPAKNNKANVLAQMGNFDDAVFLYKSILTQDPENELVENNLEFAIKNLPLKITNKDDQKKLEPEPENSIRNLTTEIADTTVTKVKQVTQKPSNFFEDIGHALTSLSINLFSLWT